ncbi:peptidase C15 [uncultured Enterovirga sp.]|uniref:pyroglutamyl-peptidase I family protein n=1 Tax=uncultured Enterovirga sp. TaxID=2026352 RepID=UPI0035C9A42B
MRLLVTGFGPFPSMPRNPSAALARAVASAPRWRLLGVSAESRILTTAYAALETELDPALAGKPDAVLMIGVAGRSRRIRVEGRATPRRSALFADAAGVRAERPEGSGVPSERRSRFPPIRALLALRREQVPARLSRDAGRYLCNAAYFRALAGSAPTLFIHIPKPVTPRPRSSPCRRHLRQEESLAAALTMIATQLLLQARRVASARRSG